MIKNVKLYDEKEYEIVKILTLGDINVGKTSIILRFVNDTFTMDYKSTIGVDMKMINVEYNTHTAQLVIWDSTGQERFQSMTKNYYKNSDVLLLIYDVKDIKSFSQTEVWLKGIIENKTDNALVYLVANKIDCGADRVVSREQGELIAKKYKIHYFEVSAMSGINIDELFEDIVSTIVDNKFLLAYDNTSIRLSVGTHRTKKEKTAECC